MKSWRFERASSPERRRWRAIERGGKKKGMSGRKGWESKVFGNSYWKKKRYLRQKKKNPTTRGAVSPYKKREPRQGFFLRIGAFS